MAAGKPGRPSDYTVELADAICERLSNSDVSLRQICAGKGMPARSTVLLWLQQHEEFRAKYTRAREEQADVVFDEMGTIERQAIARKVAPDVARVVLQSKQWRAAKLANKKYGEKSRTELTGPDGGPIQTETTLDISNLPDEQLRALAGIPIPSR